MTFKRKLYTLFIFLMLLQLDGIAYIKVQEQKWSYQTLYSDEYNIMWIGTSSGLYQWKNTGTKKILLPKNLNITSINSINNTLILGTKSGEIYTYHFGSRKLIQVGDLKSEISEIKKSTGKIFIASKGNGIVSISPSQIKRYTVKEGLSDNFIYKLFIDTKDIIWSSTDDGINMTYPDHVSKTFFMNDSIHDNLITCFDKRKSVIVCGTQLGDVYKINLHDSTILKFDNTIWNHSQVNDIRILDHSIAIATEQGAYFFDMKGQLLESVVNNIPIQKIEIDKEANIWFCGDKFLISSTGEQINLIRTIAGNPIGNIHCIVVDSFQTLYFTPDQGLVKYNLTNNIYQRINITNEAELIDINSMNLGYDGTLWVGTSGKGLFKVDTSNLNFSQIPIHNSVETSGILNITGDQEKIWVASLNGVWYSQIKKNNYVFKSLEDEYRKKKYYIYQVKKDSKNNLWLATDGQGILKLDAEGISDFCKNKNMNATVFYSIEEDAKGQIWFNAYNAGLYCCKDDSLFHLTLNNGLSSNDIISIAKYRNDYMVAVTSNSVDIINIHDFTVNHFNFESLHASIIPETNSIATDKQDYIYVGTNLGILKMYVPSYKSYATSNAFIEDISVMEKNSPRSKTIFNSDENYFRFKIASNYNLEQVIFYHYKLEGLSGKWNQTNDDEVVYPRLNPGKYKFVLQSANNPDFMNATEDSFTFTIQNPYWKTSWFIASLLFVIAISFYYYIRFREKRVSRVEQLEKEKAIAEFETLKHQVSPHFLFNSFNTLIQVIDEDPEKAIEYTQMLSDFYRSLISYRDVDLVTLDEELILLDKYIYLQKMRFGDSLILQNDCADEAIREIEIPPLTLQLLAENAIKHNTISSTKPLIITIKLHKNNLIVSNNVNEKISHEAGENMGLQNIKNRFKLFSKHEVEVYKNNQYFEIRLPILKP